MTGGVPRLRVLHGFGAVRGRGMPRPYGLACILHILLPFAQALPGAVEVLGHRP